MRIHHLNCVSSCPLGGKLMDGRSHSLRGLLACHCLLIEAGSELVLVDTGYGLRDVADPKSRLSRFFLALLDPDLRPELTAVRQIQRLGFSPDDVRHIVLTHLDFDHAGGLDDFPQAEVHMLTAERKAATARATPLDRMRYRPQQWASQARWRTHDVDDGERWFGFERVRAIPGLPPELALVPLLGHTYGHAGVAVQDGERWLLHTGDAYFFHAEMNVDRPRCTPGLRFYQWMMEKNRRARLANQARLRELVRRERDRVAVFCAHDGVEFERLAGRALDEPAARAPFPVTAPVEYQPS